MKNEIYNLLVLNNGDENGIEIKVPIEEYVDKVFNHATIVPYFQQGKLEGFIAYYMNDFSKKNAFLTMIVMNKDFQGKGIGKKLLRFAIDDIRNNNFEFFGLEVLKSNKKAIDFYVDFEFMIKEDRGLVWYMEKKIV